MGGHLQTLEISREQKTAGVHLCRDLDIAFVEGLTIWCAVGSERIDPPTAASISFVLIVSTNHSSRTFCAPGS